MVRPGERGSLIGVVAAQVRPVPVDPEATFRKFEREVHQLASSLPGFELFAFPELYLSAVGSWDVDRPSGYTRSVAEPIPGPTTERVGALARDVRRWIVAGTILEQSGRDIHNTAIAFSPEGSLVARHRKLMPWTPYESSDPGDTSAYSIFDIEGAGRVGLMICYEGWFPEIPRTLAWMGAEVIIQPTLTVTSDRAQEIVLARASAITNQCYVVNPNSGGLFGPGESVVVDPEGGVMAQGGAGEEYLTALIDFDRVRQIRERGTGGLNMVWKQLRDAAPPFPPAEKGFANGDVMRNLGPMPVSERSLDGGTTEE